MPETELRSFDISKPPNVFSDVWGLLFYTVFPNSGEQIVTEFR